MTQNDQHVSTCTVYMYIMHIRIAKSTGTESTYNTYICTVNCTGIIIMTLYVIMY